MKSNQERLIQLYRLKAKIDRKIMECKREMRYEEYENFMFTNSKKMA